VLQVSNGAHLSGFAPGRTLHVCSGGESMAKFWSLIGTRFG